MTSPFENHNLDHLSASSVNLFAAQPALWVAEKLLGRKSPVGAAAHRGSAVEAGVTRALLTTVPVDPEVLVQECVDEAERVFREKTALSGDPKRDYEGATVADITRQALNEICAYGPGVVCQQRIEWKSPELPIPWLGFSDFSWANHGILIDLKTQLRLASEIKNAHARQVAVYVCSPNFHNYEARVCYATPKKSAMYRLENPQEHLNALVKIAKTMERFLAVSKDPMELAMLLVPDLESYYFNDRQTRQSAFELWGI